MLASADYTSLSKSAPFDPILGKQMDRTKNVCVAIYDFSTMTGAVASYNCLDINGNPAVIPANAVVTRSYLDCPTACTTSASGTLAFKMNSANDIKTATAAASFTGQLEGQSTGAISAAVKNGTSDKQIVASIATGALTAGKVYCYIEYVLSVAS